MYLGSKNTGGPSPPALGGIFIRLDLHETSLSASIYMDYAPSRPSFPSPLLPTCDVHAAPRGLAACTLQGGRRGTGGRVLVLGTGLCPFCTTRAARVCGLHQVPTRRGGPLPPPPNLRCTRRPQGASGVYIASWEEGEGGKSSCSGHRTMSFLHDSEGVNYVIFLRIWASG